ncbi:hypothetical protein BHM03_00019330 [Ensete ventricosum]|nr:hypothetical protein BHM03_00019330 [Ensete ventricosum]
MLIKSRGKRVRLGIDRNERERERESTFHFHLMKRASDVRAHYRQLPSLPARIKSLLVYLSTTPAFFWRTRNIMPQNCTSVKGQSYLARIGTTNSPSLDGRDSGAPNWHRVQGSRSVPPESEHDAPRGESAAPPECCLAPRSRDFPEEFVLGPISPRWTPPLTPSNSQPRTPPRRQPPVDADSVTVYVREMQKLHGRWGHLQVEDPSSPPDRNQIAKSHPCVSRTNAPTGRVLKFHCTIALNRFGAFGQTYLSVGPMRSLVWVIRAVGGSPCSLRATTSEVTGWDGVAVVVDC